MPRKRRTSLKRTSLKQRAANRRNAQKSTGPRTEAGRRIASRNAIKHGLAANVPLLPAEDPSARELFVGELICGLAPANAAELDLAQAIANDSWRRERIYGLENTLYTSDRTQSGTRPDPDRNPNLDTALTAAQAFLDHSGSFRLLSLYEQRLNRALHTNQQALRRMQAAREQLNRVPGKDRKLSFCQ